MLERLSLRLAERIVANENGTQDDVEILNYEIGIRLANYSIIVLTIISACVFGVLLDSIVCLIALSMLRKFSGGAHFKSLTLCVLVSVLLFILVPLVLVPFVELNIVSTMIITSIVFVIMMFYAPNIFIERNSSNIDPYNKLISLAMVTCNYFIQSDVIAVAFLIQAITILPWREKHEKHIV